MPKMLIRNPLQIQEVLQQRAKIPFSAHKDLHKSEKLAGGRHGGTPCHAGREIRFNALPAACPPCRTARSARETIPTKRFSRFNTGNRGTWSRLIFSAAASANSSSKTYLIPGVITS